MADGLTSLAALSWGTSTGGAAGSAESNLTLGYPRLDSRLPPTQFHVWGAQISALISLVTSISQYYLGGTRLKSLAQNANPFSVGECGFWTDGTNPKFTNTAGTVVQVPVISDGAVSQSTNVNTNVTLNAQSGVITTQTATTAARTAESGFTVTNSFVSSTSVVLARAVAYSGTVFTNGQPDIDVTSVGSGSFVCRVINRDASNALNGTMKIHFLVI